jgi:hypothetical protein
LSAAILFFFAVKVLSNAKTKNIYFSIFTVFGKFLGQISHFFGTFFLTFGFRFGFATRVFHPQICEVGGVGGHDA